MCQINVVEEKVQGVKKQKEVKYFTILYSLMHLLNYYFGN